MNNKTLYALMVSSLICTAAMNTRAAETQPEPTNEELNIIGDCMINTLSTTAPTIEKSKVETCTSADNSDKSTPEDLAKCMGVPFERFISVSKACVKQMYSSRCVAAKMKTPILQYTGCNNAKDAAACFKGLGFSIDQVAQFKNECP